MSLVKVLVLMIGQFSLGFVKSAQQPNAVPTCNCSMLAPSWLNACNAINDLQTRYLHPGPVVWGWNGADFWHNMLGAYATVDFGARALGSQASIGGESVYPCRAVFTEVVQNVLRVNPPALVSLEGGYDDIGWAIAAYIRTGGTMPPADPQRSSYFRDAAKISENVDRNAWTSFCGGGYCWQRDNCHSSSHLPYKNAITNELGVFNIAELARYNVSTGGVARAEQIWQWLNNSGMIDNNTNLINDGLSSTCHNNGGTTWTYNQGVILGGLASLYSSTRDERYMNEATRLADATITRLVTSGGILNEPSIGDRDQQSFKGIFTTHLLRLTETPGLATEKRTQYTNFLQSNAATMLAKDKLPDGRFGATWQGPVTPGKDGDGPHDPSCAASISAAMLLTAAAAASDI